MTKRGPSAGALKPFSTSENLNSKNSIVTEWAPNEGYSLFVQINAFSGKFN